jgi:hypothetical protein
MSGKRIVAEKIIEWDRQQRVVSVTLAERILRELALYPTEGQTSKGFSKRARQLDIHKLAQYLRQASGEPVQAIMEQQGYEELA